MFGDFGAMDFVIWNNVLFADSGGSSTSTPAVKTEDQTVQKLDTRKLLIIAAVGLVAYIMLFGKPAADTDGYLATAEGATAVAFTSLRKPPPPKPAPNEPKPKPHRAEVPAQQPVQPTGAACRQNANGTWSCQQPQQPATQQTQRSGHYGLFGRWRPW